jgi:hypothetical protein
MADIDIKSKRHAMLIRHCNLNKNRKNGVNQNLEMTGIPCITARILMRRGP